MTLAQEISQLNDAWADAGDDVCAELRIVCELRARLDVARKALEFVRHRDSRWRDEDVVTPALAATDLTREWKPDALNAEQEKGAPSQQQPVRPTRVEVIDHRSNAPDAGRLPPAAYRHEYQDDGRTLKVFLRDTGEQARPDGDSLELVGRLRAVPMRAFLRIPTGTPLLSAEIPIGELCHQAAAALAAGNPVKG